MPTTRRRFLAAGVASLGAMPTVTSAACSDNVVRGNLPRRDGKQRIGSAMSCLDYGLSFICNTAAFNSVRFWIESRTTLHDDESGTAVELYQCASCKSENTFGEKDLLYKDNYDFLPIFSSDGDLLIFRRPARLSERYRQRTRATDVWGEPVFKLQTGKNVRPLQTWEQVRETTAAGVPIVSQTEIRGDETGLRAVIECPVKTMNISLEKQMYQVDTGPIAFPDLTQRYERPIDCLSLAFVVFNAPHFADFVIEQPTPVVEDGVEKCKIYHYANPFSLKASNRLLAVGAED